MRSKIELIKVKAIVVEDPDLFYLGKYSNTPKEGAIEVNRKGYYKYFNPACREYADLDYERMKGYNNGDWCMIGIIAEAEVSYKIGNYSRLEFFSSSGIWDIESDSDKDYLNELKEEELIDLKAHLEQFNVDISNFEELSKDIEIEWE